MNSIDRIKILVQKMQDLERRAIGLHVRCLPIIEEMASMTEDPKHIALADEIKAFLEHGE